MRYLLVDRVTEWRPNEVIRGIKNVAMSEDFLEFHFPRNPIMPGVLLIEALTQLTGWLEAASSDYKNWFLISKVHKCKFYGFAFPGDQIELEVTRVRTEDPSTKVYTGIGAVRGKKKVMMEFEGNVVAVEGMEDVSNQRHFFTVLTRE